MSNPTLVLKDEEQCVRRIPYNNATATILHKRRLDFCVGVGVLDKDNTALLDMSREDIHVLAGSDISLNDW